MNREHYVNNMDAKLSWMRRSQDRMHKSEFDLIEVQDHFLGYVHASQLIWHYFGAYCKSVGLPKKEPERLVNRWHADSLTEEERTVWTVLNGLRNEDVHVMPIEAARSSEPQVISYGGTIVTYGGKVVAYGEYRYSVTFESENYDVFKLVRGGLLVFDKFIRAFERGEIV